MNLRRTDTADNPGIAGGRTKKQYYRSRTHEGKHRTHQAGLGGIRPLEELAQNLAVLGHELINLVQHHDNHRRVTGRLPVAFQLRAERFLDVGREIHAACNGSPERAVHRVGVREGRASKGVKIRCGKCALGWKRKGRVKR